jgi:hypothetical protein
MALAPAPSWWEVNCRLQLDRDRLVKLVVLTAAGVRTKDEVSRRLYAPPLELFELDRADLRRRC